MTTTPPTPPPPRIRTSLVGSYAQPDWLLDREALRARLPARVPKGDLWRVPREHLEEAKNDAVLSVLADQHAAGLDIVTDGEARRESYSEPFANALDGVARDRVETVVGRAGKPNDVPVVTGPLRRSRPVHVDDVRFLRAHTDRTVKVTLPGPFTLSQLAVSEHHDSKEALARDYADCLRDEIRALFDAGADIVQLDEPYLQARQEDAARYGVSVVNRAIEGASGTTAIHVCFGYAQFLSGKEGGGYGCLPLLGDVQADQVSIEAAQPKVTLGPALAHLRGKTVLVGVLDLGDETPETPEQVADRLRRALEHLPPERLIAAPDCGMKYLPRASARGKLRALVDGAAQVNRELAGG
jgi:5-methyltetrahydropteroyltriglutamate--homocysteine methyltransferase